ncbi:MAG: GNAT family N-acetyltransferase [Casimicrobiaceae bacterium]
MPGRELIRPVSSVADVAAARALFEEYAAGLRVDLCFQGFAQELESLPGAYAPPRGRLLLAGVAAAPAGCVALRPLPPDGATTAVAEIKRLYVRPAGRGSGLGTALARAIVAEARAIGYRELKLDTLSSMTAAQALYRSLGFRECAAYYHNPLGGTVYMALAL